MKRHFLTVWLAITWTSNLLAQAPALSSIQFLPGDAAIGPAYQDQQSPFLARGGNISLAVWADQRTGGSGSDIYATRMDASGNLLDAVPFVVSQAAAGQVMPRAVWNGVDWLVAWQSQEPTEFYFAMQVMAARVSPQGVVLDPTPIRVTPFLNSQSLIFAAASDGTNWLVTTQGSAPGEAGVLGFRVSPAGTVLDPTGITLLAETYYQRSGLEVGFAGDEFLLMWTEWNSVGLDDVYALRLTPSLQRLGASPLVVAASTDYDVTPRVATDGTNFFVAYERYNTCCGQGGRVFGTRVSHSGQVLDLAGLDISGDVGTSTVRHPSVAWDGANWFIAWMVPGVSVARVSPSGTVLNRGGFQVDAASAAFKEEPQIATLPGGGARVVWSDYRAGGYNPHDIYSAAVAASGQPASGSCISVAAPSQLSPRLASNGNGYLAVFLSAVSGSQRVLAQRLDAAGSPLDLQPTQIAPLGRNIFSPAVAGTGSLYLVVWEDRGSNTIYGRRVQNDGSVLDATPIVIMPGNTPDVAAIGGNFLVVDTHAPSNPQYRFPFCTRVRGSDGALLDASPVGIGGSFALIPRVAALSDRWLAVWEGHPTHDDPVANVYAAFVDTSGAPAPAFAVTQDDFFVRYHYRPAIAASGTSALVLWTDPRFGNSAWNIFARRVLPDGTVLDADGPAPILQSPLTPPPTYPGLQLATGANNKDHPAVAWNGAEYVTAWEDTRANSFFLDQRTDVFGTRVTSAAVVLDPDGIALANSPLPEITPAIAGVRGTTVYAAAVFRDQSPYAAYRIGISTSLKQAPVGPILSAARTGLNLLLSWPTNAAGFVLQSAPALPASGWTPVAQSPTLNDSRFVVSIPMTNSTAIYRLFRQ